MNRIFLNDPKKPKPFSFVLIVILLLVLLAGQVILISRLFHKRMDELKVEDIEETTVQLSISATEPPPRQALSVKQESMQEILNEQFGELPRVQARNSEYKSLSPVKGIYLGRAKNLDEALALASWSEVNAFVIDVKESWGLTYDSQVPLAQEIGASTGELDLEAIVERCHAAGVRVIARIVCFKDELMPQKRPDLCIIDTDGQLLTFPLEGDQSFANPYDTRYWAYLVDIATEVVNMGVDEIQFDYVRFPTGAPDSDKPPIYKKVEETIPKEYAINRFLEYARIKIQEELGVPVTADLFSIVMTSEVDGKLIGQNWSTIGLTAIDAICPMIYPSHYANSSLGSQGNGVGSYIGHDFFDKPDMEPYEVVQNAMIDGEKASFQQGYAKLRPWLQAFTANWLVPGYYMEYGPWEIRQQIQALYDAGYSEWILWNAEYSYPEDCFLTKAEGQLQEEQQAQESIVRASERASEAEAEAAETEESRRFPIATAPPKTEP